MGIKTQAGIEIEAPPEAVWDCLVDRAKVAQWGGGDPTYMPEDKSKIKTGYHQSGTLPAPDGPRPLEFEVTECDPPNALAVRETYAGGEATSAWKLTADGSKTRLEVSNDTDYAQMAAISDQAEEQLAKVPKFARAFVEHQMHKVTEDIASGEWDDNPMIKGAMQKSVEEGLKKLKQLAES